VHKRRTAGAASVAAADVVVGTHAHVIQGAGTLGETYVSYRPGGFHQYQGARPDTAALQLQVTADGQVVADDPTPALIPDDAARLSPSPARPVPMRSRTGLTSARAPVWRPDQGRMWTHTPPPWVRSGRSLRRWMIGTSHDPGACPVPLSDLRHLTLSYVGFGGRAHTGDLVFHADHAAGVVAVFRDLREARWPNPTHGVRRRVRR
jgi:hypothetical protein